MDSPKREVCKPFSIKMYQEDIDRFQKIASEMDNVKSNREAFNALMDFFENPKTVKIDNPELIKKNQDLQDEIDELMECNKNLVAQVENLEAKIEELTNSGNENAMAAQRIQMELDKANETIAARANRPENFIEMYVHPIFFYFLKKMTEIFNKKYKKNLSYGDFLVDLFRRDMLHSRGNNLPDVISESEFFKVVDKYAEQHPDEFTKDEIKLLKSV